MLRITEVPVQLAITTQPFLVRNELGKSDSQITNYTLLHSTFFSKLHVLLFVVCLWFLLLFDWLVGFFSRQSFFMYPELFWFLLCRPDPCQLQDPPVSLSLYLQRAAVKGVHHHPVIFCSLNCLEMVAVFILRVMQHCF